MMTDSGSLPMGCPEISVGEQEAAINSAQPFGQRWRLPMAANLIAMLPRRIKDSDILQAFKTAFTGSPLFPATLPMLINTEHEREECSHWSTKIVPYHTLP